MKDRHYVFIISIALTLLGVVMVFSSSAVYAGSEYTNSFFFLKKELLWVIIGFLMLLISYNLNLKFLRKVSPYLFVLTLLLVLLTYTSLGVKVGGAKRWIRMGCINFQPSEFLKFGVACMLGWYCSREKFIKEKTFKDFCICLFIIGISFASVLGQPDFGTSSLIGVVGFIVMFVAGINIRYLLSLSFLSLPLAYFFIVKFPYRLQRVISFLDPWEDPQGKSFQIIQSFLAIGRGKITGVGLGESAQKLFYLPAAHTDFIFSILAEELGFMGSVSVILAFVALSFFCVKIAMKSQNVFSYLLALSCILYITIQAIFNIAVVTGSVPTKGIALPFISFGGSSLALTLFAIGFIMNVSKQNESLKISVQQKMSVNQKDKLRIKIRRVKRFGLVSA